MYGYNAFLLVQPCRLGVFCDIVYCRYIKIEVTERVGHQDQFCTTEEDLKWKSKAGITTYPRVVHFTSGRNICVVETESTRDLCSKKMKEKLFHTLNSATLEKKLVVTRIK